MKAYRLVILTVLSLILIFHCGISQWISAGNISGYNKIENGIVVSIPPSKMIISVIAPDIIRVRFSKDGIFDNDKSWAVNQTANTNPEYTISDSAESIQISTKQLVLKIDKTPCRISFYDTHGNLINRDDPVKGIAYAGEQISVWKEMPEDEHYFGFGEKAGSLEKKGKSYSNWNTDIPAYKADTDPLYQTIPFFYGIKKGITYGIFFDNTYYSFFNMGKESPNQYSFGATDGELNYYFIYGPKPNDVLQKYSSLTGHMPLPPRWSIGYQQCRWSYYPESKVREIASTFRKKQIPCDAIYLDIHYMDGYRCFTWDKERFPDPKQLVSDLAKDGFKMVVIIDPGIKKDSLYWVYNQGVQGDHFVKYPDGNYFTGTVWPGDCVFPDFIKNESRDWWGSLYKDLVGIGVKGFWNDMNEPSVFNGPNKTFPLDVIHDENGVKTDHRKNHNIYGMQMVRGSYEGLLKLNRNERPFVLTRANYAGGQRYAAAWTGDNISSWEHLEMAIPMCLNLSISGQPFVGTDIGGFVGSPSGELYTRWLQLGTFTPLMRTHTEINSKDQEPWSYGTEYEAINKYYIELRYKLLPYIYTQFYKASTDGIPIIRPLFFDYPEDQDTYWRDKEFLFGDAFLVAPVLWEGAIKREVRLPEGEWYNYWTDEKIVGPKYVTIEAPISKIPLFVKAGSIIPTQQVVQFSDQEPINPLTIDIYPAIQSASILYEDDGKSFNFRNGGYCLRTFDLKQNKKGYNITLHQSEGNYKPASRNLVIRLHDQKEKPTKVSFGKVLLTQFDWKYIKSDSILELHLKDSFAEETFQIEY
ncbi:MAG: glycoside hydrolase family 31 protein [Ignavibacteriales bacterium]|nr:glycoside hydrolase family 31 protein [Ignavibacteriales bacterium]